LLAEIVRIVRGYLLAKPGLSKYAWFHSFGYSNDPLCIKPNADITAREQEISELLSHLSSGNIITLYGANGIGKTSVLMNLSKKAGEFGDLKIHILNMADGFEQVKELFGDSAKRSKNKIALLLDECDHLGIEEIEYLRQIYESDKVYAIILAFPEQKSQHLTIAMRQRIARHIYLRRLNMMELTAMLEQKLGRDSLIDSSILQQLSMQSSGNPRKFLLGCQQVLMHIHCSHRKEQEIPIEKVLEDIMQQSSMNIGSETIDCKCKIGNLTPLQQLMLETLLQKPCTLAELSEATGSSNGTIGKQISLLSLNANKNYMKNKGITKPLVEKKWHNRRMMYSLSSLGKQLVGG